MERIVRQYFSAGTAVLMAILLFIVCGAGPMRADTIDDPAITPGDSATLIGTDGGAQTSNVWSLSTVVQDTGSHSVSFLNGTGSPWSSIEIVANYTDTAAHTFTCYEYPSVANLPAGATNPFSVCPDPTTGNGMVTASTVTFNLSGGTGVAIGDYFVLTYTNWNTNGSPHSVLSSFDFSANGGAPTSAPVPEPTTILLVGSGLVGLAQRRRLKKV